MHRVDLCKVALEHLPILDLVLGADWRAQRSEVIEVIQFRLLGLYRLLELRQLSLKAARGAQMAGWRLRRVRRRSSRGAAAAGLDGTFDIVVALGRRCWTNCEIRPESAERVPQQWTSSGLNGCAVQLACVGSR